MSDQELNQILDKIRKNDNKNFPKSKVGFQKWTKKMSKNENLKKVLKKTLEDELFEHNALNFIF